MGTLPGQIASVSSTPQVSSGSSSMEIVPLTGRPIVEKKASVYAEVVKNLNKARESGLPFKVCPLLFASLKFIMRFLYLIKLCCVACLKVMSFGDQNIYFRENSVFGILIQYHVHSSFSNIQ